MKEITFYNGDFLEVRKNYDEWLTLNHWGVIPDIVTFGKSFGNGFPVTAMVVSEENGQALEKISASSSYGGNPMACAAALASIEVIEEEDILQNVRTVGDFFMKRMLRMKEQHPIIGDVKGKGFLLGIELVKDKKTKEIKFDDFILRLDQVIYFVDINVVFNQCFSFLDFYFIFMP